MNINETIIPLIEICRKLQKCNKQQLSQFALKLINILISNNNRESIEKTLLNLLCNNHTQFSLSTFDELLQSLPNDKHITTINDTITMSDIMLKQNINKIDETPKIKNLIEIPKDLLIHLFQYLAINDLYELDKTCRYLCIISHDINCLYHLVITPLYGHYKTVENILIKRRYTHPRYSRIKSLGLYRNGCPADDWIKCVSSLQIFKHIKSLNYHNWDDMSVPTTFPQNILDPIINVNLSSLKIMKLEMVCIDDVYDVIIQCKNMEELTLNEVYGFDPYCDDIEDCPMYNMLNQTDCNDRKSELYPLPYLKEFCIDISSIADYLENQYFVYWILANNRNTNKIFTISKSQLSHDGIYDIDRIPQFFNLSDYISINIQKQALLNISHFNLKVHHKDLADNISNWIKNDKKIKFKISQLPLTSQH